MPASPGGDTWRQEAGGPTTVATLVCTTAMTVWDIADPAATTPRDQRALRDMVSPPRPS